MWTRKKKKEKEKRKERNFFIFIAQTQLDLGKKLVSLSHRKKMGSFYFIYPFIKLWTICCFYCGGSKN
jgi:hypothetical protein